MFIMAGRVSSTDMAAISIGASNLDAIDAFWTRFIVGIAATISYLNGSGQRHRIAHQVHFPAFGLC